MAEPLGVTPDRLRKTAEDLADVSSRMEKVLSPAQRELDADGGAPWGDDEAGNQFAEGAAGFLSQWQYVRDSIQAKVDLLNEYRDGLRSAADTLQQQDQH
jgi:uncharacterized protein YukE